MWLERWPRPDLCMYVCRRWWRVWRSWKPSWTILMGGVSCWSKTVWKLTEKLCSIGSTNSGMTNIQLQHSTELHVLYWLYCRLNRRQVEMLYRVMYINSDIVHLQPSKCGVICLWFVAGLVGMPSIPTLRLGSPRWRSLYSPSASSRRPMPSCGHGLPMPFNSWRTRSQSLETLTLWQHSCQSTRQACLFLSSHHLSSLIASSLIPR